MRIVKYILLLSAICLTACGGGGGGATSSGPTKAVLKINLTGTLPTNFAMAGLGMTVTLPTNVTPELVNGAVLTSIIVPSGTYAGGTPTTPVYIPVNGGSLGNIQIALANAVPAGITQVGEVATLTLQLANGAAPTVTSFSISNVTVIDTLGSSNTIAMGANVVSVTLQ